MMRAWGTPVEKERWRRIRLSVAAYAYEFESASIMSDGDYDALSLEVDLSIDTGRRDLDTFFRTQFSPYTGQWIHKHPELDKVKSRYDYFYGMEKK